MFWSFEIIFVPIGLPKIDIRLSIIFYYILFYPILFYSTLFQSILFYSFPFYLIHWQNATIG